MKNMQNNSSFATIGDMLAAQGFVLEATEQGIQKVEVDPRAPRPRRKTKVKYAFPEATFTKMPRKPEMLAVTNKELGITVEFPIFNKTFTNTLDEFGNLAREQKLPPYIGFWEKNRIHSCVQSLSVELMLQARNGLALPLGGIYAPVAVSAEIPAGHYKILNDSKGIPCRILVNEAEMALQAVDSDGDRCAVLSDGSRQGETVAFIKIPFTSQAPTLKKFDGTVFESFGDLDMQTLDMICSVDPKKDSRNPFQYQVESESTTPSAENRAVMSIFDQFIKNHTGAPVGIITTEWNALECQNFIKHGYEEGVKLAFETFALSTDKDGNEVAVKGRFQDVEGNGLKLSRKDGSSLKSFCYEQFIYPKLNGVAKGLLSSASGIRKLGLPEIESMIEMDKDEVISRYWKCEGLTEDGDKFGNADLIHTPTRESYQETVIAMIDHSGVEATRKNLLQQVSKRSSIRNLSLYAAFFDVVDMPEAAAKVRIVLNNMIETNRNKGWKLRDGGLISRLLRDGMMTITNLPVNHISGLPLQVVELTRNGKRIALFDQKREGNDLPEKGIGYHYLLVPVFDKTLNQWVDGKTAMQHAFRQEMRVVDKYDELTGDEWQEYEYRCFDKYDFLVKNPETNEAVRGLGVKKSDWDNIPVQVTILQEAISSYLGKVGMLVNGAEDRKTISEMSLTVARNVVTINYGRFEEAPEKMYSVFEEATKQLQTMLPGFTICPGNKQQNPLIRKYVLGRSNGTAVWAHPEAHMSRPGKNQSQLSRALLKVNARIALVDTTTQTGGWASTQGVEAQKSDKCFYPQVMQDPEEAREYAESEGIEFKKLTSKIVHTWTGGKKQIWLKEAKEAIELGKFIDARFSLKFMPAPLGGEVFTSQGEDVHFVIPITEIIDKGSMKAMLSAGLREETITITERQGDEERTTTVKALIIETPVYRSGSHSENTPAKVGTSTVSGFDQFAVRYPLMKMGWSIAEPHLQEFTLLQKFITDLRETVANA